ARSSISSVSPAATRYCLLPVSNTAYIASSQKGEDKTKERASCQPLISGDFRAYNVLLAPLDGCHFSLMGGRAACSEGRAGECQQYNPSNRLGARVCGQFRAAESFLRLQDRAGSGRSRHGVTFGGLCRADCIRGLGGLLPSKRPLVPDRAFGELRDCVR